MDDSQRAYALGADEGQAFWFMGALQVAKATGAQTGQAFAVFDQLVPAGYSPPRHVHRNEDEALYVLEGQATFTCGDQTFDGAPGAFVFLPRGVEHTFKVGHSTARMLTIAAPASFGEFVAAAGEPAPVLALPPPDSTDQERLAQMAVRHGIDITGPPLE